MQVNFNRNSMEGQLHKEERIKLYDTICEYKPKVLFEIGTWKGGGSTYIISSAIHDNGFGKLHTIEIFKDFYDHAINLYNGELLYLKEFINFNFGDSLDVYPKILDELDSIDFVLLDGKEEAQQTLDEYNLLRPKFKSGTIVMCHDWKTAKSQKVKEVLLTDEWETLFILDSAVGFAGFKLK